MKKLWMVFDVESVGLHGEGFAVGFIVVGGDGRELAAGRFSCDPVNASGSVTAGEWVAANVPAFDHNCRDPDEVREKFWAAWMHWKYQGATLAADCLWPVESRFLIHCVQGDPDAREWQGPYPLVSIDSIRLAAGFDPLAAYPRLLASERPPHDPLADARQSARLLLEALAAIGS